MGTCERCNGSTVEVPTTIGNKQLLMRRCSTCDITEWRRGEQVIDLREVLDLTAEANPSTRRKVPRGDDPQTASRSGSGSGANDAEALGL